MNADDIGEVIERFERFMNGVRSEVKLR